MPGSGPIRFWKKLIDYRSDIGSRESASQEVPRETPACSRPLRRLKSPGTTGGRPVQQVKLGYSEFAERLLDRCIRILDPDSSGSELGAKPSSTRRTKSNPVPHEGKGERPVIDVAQLLTPPDRRADRFFGVALPA
jgi:hypothetical protein